MIEDFFEVMAWITEGMLMSLQVCVGTVAWIFILVVVVFIFEGLFSGNKNNWPG